MPTGRVIGVLSPWLGGWYFGGIIRGIVAAAEEAGAGVFAVQTLDAGTDQLEVTVPPDLGAPVGLDHADGYIVITNAVSPRHIAAIQRAGRPAVVVGHTYSGLRVPVVASDNRRGVHDAVAHLVGHGHERIAFAGYLGATDVAERYDAYCDALKEHGIGPDPALVFELAGNLHASGVAAARDMIAAGVPSTAVVAGTDANALGIVEGLVAAGYRVPRDQAVVGFDDLAIGAVADPPLTTVRQSYRMLGEVAVAALHDVIDGQTDDGGTRTVPTSLVVRESCGCPPGTGSGSSAGADPADAAQLQAAMGTQFEVSMELLRSHEEDPRTLRWLARTSAAAGSLGLWRDGRARAGARSPVTIAGAYGGDGGAHPEIGEELPVGAFPPMWLVDVARRRGGLVMVVPVKVGASDWGLLAVADRADVRVVTGREPINQWGALLAVALDHEAVMRELRRQEDRLRAAALYDHLTGLPNRTLFLDRLRQAIRRNRRDAGQQFAVLFLDLDGFKVINDSKGHPTGDKLLVQVAERVAGVLREADTAARYGGDEFLVLLDGIEDPHTPTAVAERLQTALARPFDLDGNDVVISASIGITVSNPRYADAEDMLRDADIAMYWAKSHGKGTHAVFDVEMHARAVDRLEVETDLRWALERREFDVAYQPIVDLATGRIRAFEALVRWSHPQRGVLLPAEFLPVAEETGLIAPLGRRVVDEAARRLAGWQRRHHRDLWMSVNVSGRQFWDPYFVDDIAAALRRHRVIGGGLAIEVTEDVIMRDVDEARRILEELHALGCRLSIDVFGTGASSLEVLHHLPIDALKVDRTFVSRLGTDRRSGELVSTIVLMGGNLDVVVVAEGVETTDQRDRLVGMGCALGQGFLYAPALPAGEAEALFARLRVAG